MIIKYDAAHTKHVSQSLVRRKPSKNVNGNAGRGGGSDDDGDAADDNEDIMSQKTLQEIIWGILSSVILNLKFLIYFTIELKSMKTPLDFSVKHLENKCKFFP